MAKTYSGREIIRVLTRYFGCVMVGQKGSHVKLRRVDGSRTLTTVVPLHREVARGTLRGALELVEITETTFRAAARK